MSTSETEKAREGGAFVPRQEEDAIARRPLARVMLLALVVLTGSLVVAWLFSGRARGRSPAPAAPAATLETSLIGETRRGRDLMEGQRAELDRLRWVDRDAGLAQIPIERAMDLVAEDAGGAR